MEVQDLVFSIHPRQRLVAALVFIDVQAVVPGLLLEQRLPGFAQQSHAVPAKARHSRPALVPRFAGLLVGLGDTPAQRVVFEAGRAPGLARCLGAVSLALGPLVNRDQPVLGVVADNNTLNY